MTTGDYPLPLFPMDVPLYQHDPLAMTGGAQGGRRRPDYTERAKAAIERGMHPLGGVLARNGRTCGDCRFAERGEGWHICALKFTASAATDLRLWWPSCAFFSSRARGAAAEARHES